VTQLCEQHRPPALLLERDGDYPPAETLSAELDAVAAARRPGRRGTCWARRRSSLRRTVGTDTAPPARIGAAVAVGPRANSDLSARRRRLDL
jgi:hypothetical protein